MIHSIRHMQQSAWKADYYTNQLFPITFTIEVVAMLYRFNVSITCAATQFCSDSHSIFFKILQQSITPVDVIKRQLFEMVLVYLYKGENNGTSLLSCNQRSDVFRIKNSLQYKDKILSRSN